MLSRKEALEALINSISLSKEYGLYFEFRMFYLKYRREGWSVESSTTLALHEWDLF